MALSNVQIQQLDVAAGRKTADDIRNIDYAMKTFGYKPPAGYSSTPITNTPPVAPASSGTANNLDANKIRELDLAAAKGANKTATDITNINYAAKNYGYKPPVEITPTVNASNLKENVPDVATITPKATDSASSFIASLTASKTAQDQYMSQFNAPVDQATTERTGLKDKLVGLLDKLKGKGAAITAAEQAAGVPEQQKQLNEINLQIAQRTGEFEKAAGAVENINATGLSRTIGGVAGNIRRQQAVEIGALTSVAQALQGNITLAQQTADRTVELQYEDAQQEIDNIKTQLDLNSDTLSAAEKKQAEELKIYLDAKQKDLDDAKTEKQGILSLAIQAAQMGADSATLNKITTSTDLLSAIQNAGQYGKTTTEKKYASGIIGEYQFYAEQEMTAGRQPVSFNEYQNMDANRKAKATGGGGGGGGSGSGSASDYASIQSDMNSIRGSDGYYDTAKYAQVRENVAVNAPKLLSWFDSTYKAENVLNPNDRTAQKYFQTGTAQLKAEATPAEDTTPWWKFW